MQTLISEGTTASVTISTKEVGLGLSPDLFRKFANLASIAAQGNFTCPGAESGLPCTLTMGCEKLPNSMYFSFCVDDCSSTGKNITVPLAAFANGNGNVC